MTGVIGWPWLKICLMGGGNAAMPKFEVVSEYKPSGEPRKSGTFAGTP